jgi:hypothetical protein
VLPYEIPASINLTASSAARSAPTAADSRQLVGGHIAMGKVDGWANPHPETSLKSRLTLLLDPISSHHRRLRQQNSNTNRDGTHEICLLV